MDITLLGENLSPSADMERQETIERLNMMIEKLGNMKETGFVKAQAAEQSKPTNKFWKTEKKGIYKFLIFRVIATIIQSPRFCHFSFALNFK